MDYIDLPAKVQRLLSLENLPHVFKLFKLSILPPSNSIVQNIPIKTFIFIQLNTIQYVFAFQVSISVEILCDKH